MASTRPNSESTFMENPSIGKNINAPIRDTGIANVGMMVALQSWIKMNTTRITSIRATISVMTISRIPAVIGRVESSDTS